MVWNRLRILSTDTRSVLQVLTRGQMGRSVAGMDGRAYLILLIRSLARSDARLLG